MVVVTVVIVVVVVVVVVVVSVLAVVVIIACAVVESTEGLLKLILLTALQELALYQDHLVAGVCGYTT